MSTSLNRAAELAELTPPPSIGRTQQFLADVSGPAQSFAQGIAQSRAPMPIVGLQSQSFSDQMANPVSRMLPADSPAIQDPYASRRADIQEFTKWLNRREALRSEGDSEPSEQTVQVSAADLSNGVVFKPSVRPVRVQADQPLQPVAASAGPDASVSSAPATETPKQAAAAETPPEPPREAPRETPRETIQEAPQDHWVDRAAPAALRRVWTTNLALGSYILGGMGGGAAGAAAPLALGMGAARGMIGGGTGDFELLNHLRFVRSTLERLPVSPEQVPGPAAAAFHQAVPTLRLLHTMSAGGASREALIDQLVRYRPNMIGLVGDTRTAMGGGSKGFSNFPSSGGGPASGFAPGGSSPGYVVGSPGGGGYSGGDGFPGGYSGGYPGGSGVGFPGATGASYGPGGSLPSLSRGPIASMPSFHSAVAGRGSGGGFGGDGGGVPSEMTGPEYGQVTFASPPAQMSSPDMASGGSAVSFSPADLARGTSPLDSGGLSSLSSSMPGAQMFYPALSGGSLPPGAANVPLSSNLVQQMLSRSAGGPVSPSLAESIAFKGAAAGSGGGGGGGGPANFQLVPSGRPAPGASGLFGNAGRQALEHAGGGQAVRGGPLDFMGVPVRLAPSLGGKSSLASEQAVHAAVNKTGGGGTMRPQQFQLLRSKLFPSTSSANVEPNSSAWQQAAAAHGLRSANPEALMAPDSRLKPLSPSAPTPQVEGGPANLKDLGLSPNIARMPPLTPSRISAINNLPGGPGAIPGAKGPNLPPIGSRSIGGPQIGPQRNGSPTIGGNRFGPPAATGVPGSPPLSRFSQQGGSPAPGGPSAQRLGQGTGTTGAPASGFGGARGYPNSGPMFRQPGSPIGVPPGSRPPSPPLGSNSTPGGPFQSGIGPRLGRGPLIPSGGPTGGPPPPEGPGSRSKGTGRSYAPPFLGQHRAGSDSTSSSGNGQFSNVPGGGGPSAKQPPKPPADFQLPNLKGGNYRGSDRGVGPRRIGFEPTIGTPTLPINPPPPPAPSPGAPGTSSEKSLPMFRANHKPDRTEDQFPPAPGSGPMDLHRKPPIGLQTAGQFGTPPPPPAGLALDFHSPSFHDPQPFRGSPGHPPDLEFAPGRATGVQRGKFPNVPPTSRTYHHTSPPYVPDRRPEMALKSPPPKSSGPSSTKTIIQKLPTTGGAAGSAASTGTKTSASTSSKKSGANDVDLLASEVWTILRRRLEFESLRSGRR